MGVPVPTSLGIPAQYKGHRAAEHLKPKGVFGVEKQMNTFWIRYAERLDAKAAQIAEELKLIHVRNNDQPLVLLCWCDLGDRNGWCHRRMAASWLEEHTKVSVPELGTCLPVNLYPNSTSDGSRQETMF
jgi:hypothetical protein